jgi:pantetheine hydrolase
VNDIDTGIVTTCYIVACTGAQVSSCGYRFPKTTGVKDVVTFQEISISGIFPYWPNDFYIPNGVDTSIMPLNPSEFSYFNRDHGSSEKSIGIKMTKRRSNLLSFGITGRRFKI